MLKRETVCCASLEVVLQNTPSLTHVNLCGCGTVGMQLVETLCTRYSNGLEACVYECVDSKHPEAREKVNLQMHHLKASPPSPPLPPSSLSPDS